MQKLAITPNKSLNKAYRRQKISRNEINKFKGNLNTLLQELDEQESEEHLKNNVTQFLNDTWYKGEFLINTKGRTDLVIHNDKTAKSNVGVLLEVKKPSNKNEMVSITNLNKKALQELLLYYLRERIESENNDIKHLVVTNVYEWFIFDASVFYKYFYDNKELLKSFNEWNSGQKDSSKTELFYKEIAAPAIEKIKEKLEYTYVDLRDYTKFLSKDEDSSKLISLFKLLSPIHLLKQPFANDSNTLDKQFYKELLHIIGLEEIKDGGKKIIQRKAEGKRNAGSLLENAINIMEERDRLRNLDKPSRFGDNYNDQLYNVALELAITWINRVLFLKLLESQLVVYHKGDKAYRFLSSEVIPNYDALDQLFFGVLAKKYEDRNERIKNKFSKIPYLNSSLFEPTELEGILEITQLNNNIDLALHSSTVIKDNKGKRLPGNRDTLTYLFDFLDAYDFASEGTEEIQEDTKSLINASVLGLIFEKINGYKDGSFYTPGFITMYMCKETIRRAVVQKFNEAKKWELKEFDQLYDKIEDKKEANQIINSLRICDPAVGSGHFLVSALNEIIAIKSELKILMDKDGKTLRDYDISIENDELVIEDDNEELFQYTLGSKEKQRVQETLFQEKQTIIENCLFGVDINPNSVKICRLRLWIELLKNAYYKNDTELETLPNIDINIKCGNSLISRFDLDTDLHKALKKSKWNIDTYKVAVDTYRNATSKEEKREMERLIEDIKSDFRSEISKNDPKVKKLYKLSGELANLTTQTSMFDMSAKEKKEWNKKVEKLTKDTAKIETDIEEIKSNKIYDNAFEWRFEFPEVLDNNGDFRGFDVVIGNPPWGANLPENALKFIKTWNHDIVVRMVDTFMFFINLSFKIKSNNGLVCQIIPDVLLYQVDNEKLRKKILNEHHLLFAINLGDQIFEDVARPSCIVLIENKNLSNKTNVFEFKSNEDIPIEQIKPIVLETKIFNELPNTIFATRKLSSYKMLGRFDENLLADLLDEDGIQRGVSPDLKEAFIVNDDLIEKFKLEKGYIFPTITGGRDIKRYYVSDIGKRLIYTKKSDDEKLIPHIINFVSKFKKRITCKEVKQGKHPIWALHRARDRNIFEKKEKIVGVITGDKISVSLDTQIMYPTDGLYVFSTNGNYSNQFLLGLLNSKLCTYLYRLISMEENRTLAQIKPSILQKLPVSDDFDKNIVSLIESKVTSILTFKKQGSTADTSALENEIDQLVYKLYGLTGEEIKIVEGGN